MELDYEQYKLVKEALHERRIFLQTAPYLSAMLPIMLPIYKCVLSCDPIFKLTQHQILANTILLGRVQNVRRLGWKGEHGELLLNEQRKGARGFPYAETRRARRSNCIL